MRGPKNTSQDVILVDSIGPSPSPFLPRNLILLFRRPSEFFKSQFSLSHKPNVVLIAWCLGIAASLDRIESSLTREELGRARPGWEQLGPLVLDSWLGLWIWLLVGGALAGLVYWYLGGWWFRLRVRWSGDADAGRSAARLVMVYSAFVYSGPVVLMLIIQTLMYPNYGVAFENDLITPLIVAIFSFWSIGTSYIGVKSTFAVSLWKAKIWFIVLPLVFYIAVFGVAIAVYEIMSGQPSP